VRTAKSAGCARALRVNAAGELPDDLSGVVGVIAGASAPESLVDEVLRRLAPAEGTEEVRAVPEDEYFPLPRELREVLRAVAAAIGAVAFAPPAGPGAAQGPKDAVDGRDLSAAQVLAALG
jgi:4-hydroxy-3-methylbut-2-enyl diphosphate reductase